jgi:hypothetical protein
MIFIPSYPDEAATLSSEYQNRTDKDGNDLVYGIDFIITSNDPEKPMMLRMVDEQMEDNGDPVPAVQMFWSDYLKTYRRV